HSAFQARRPGRARGGLERGDDLVGGKPGTQTADPPRAQNAPERRIPPERVRGQLRAHLHGRTHARQLRRLTGRPLHGRLHHHRRSRNHPHTSDRAKPATSAVSRRPGGHHPHHARPRPAHPHRHPSPPLPTATSHLHHETPPPPAHTRRWVLTAQPD